MKKSIFLLFLFLISCSHVTQQIYENGAELDPNYDYFLIDAKNQKIGQIWWFKEDGITPKFIETKTGYNILVQNGKSLNGENYFYSHFMVSSLDFDLADKYPYIDLEIESPLPYRKTGKWYFEIVDNRKDSYPILYFETIQSKGLNFDTRMNLYLTYQLSYIHPEANPHRNASQNLLKASTREKAGLPENIYLPFHTIKVKL